jgi:hypothetical protein
MGYAECLPAWSLMGVREFFIDRRSLFNVQTNNTSIVEYIHKGEFIAVLKQYRALYERYSEMMERIRLGETGT